MVLGCVWEFLFFRRGGWYNVLEIYGLFLFVGDFDCDKGEGCYEVWIFCLLVYRGSIVRVGRY